MDDTSLVVADDGGASSERIVDKAGLIPIINSGAARGLELGAAGFRARPNYVTVDSRDFPSVDIVGDVFDVLAQIEDGKINGVYASHFIEHIPDLTRLLTELIRVCEPGAKMELIAPHFSNAFFYSDVTHSKFFGLYTFCYLAESNVGFSRTVPDYARVDGLILEDVKLGFRSYRPFYIRHALRKIAQFIVNLSNYTKEFYEEAFTGLVSCYDVEYHLTVSTGGDVSERDGISI